VPPKPPGLVGAADDDDDDAPASFRIGWAKLLAQVLVIDVTLCRKCGGRMRVLEVVDDYDDIARILHGARVLAPVRIRRVAPVSCRCVAPVFSPGEEHRCADA